MTTRIPLLLLLLVVGGAALGCGSARAPLTPSDPLTVPTHEEAHYFVHDITGRYALAFNDESAFVAYWGNAFDDTYIPPPEPPAIDFATRTALVLGAGSYSTGGYILEIGTLTLAGERLDVPYSLTSPGPGCGVTLSFTNPVLVVSLPKHRGDIVFHRTDLIAERCGTT